MVAEGPHLLAEALRGRWRTEAVFATLRARERFGDLLARTPCETVEVSEAAFAAASATEHGQGVLALLRPQTFSWRDVIGHSAAILVLDGLQDPGNAGTLVRSGEAFGATGVVFTQSSVRVSNPKFLRATAGSIFRMPYLEEVGAADLLSRMAQHSVALWALAAQGETPLMAADFGRPWALAVGSEGAGVGPELLRNARPLRIPSAAVESLNAAVAGSIALFEAARQRQTL